MVSPGAVPLAKWIVPKVLFKGCCLALFTPALGNRNRDPKAVMPWIRSSISFILNTFL